MDSNIFIPKKIKIGYQERSDTYTKKLAYIIYYDAKNVLRKEKSWNSWRNQKIDFSDFDNEPTEGFVLNKKVGGYKYSWNPRQTYCRVYDPRGFEFEITIPNLLYILENTNSIKGKGLEGKFVYGWDGTELVLIPEDAPEYIQMQTFTDLQSKSVSKKELKTGYKYLTKDNHIVTYLGYYPTYTYYSFGNYQKVQYAVGKQHWVYNYTSKCFTTIPKIGYLAQEIEQDIDFANLVDRLLKESQLVKIEQQITLKEISYQDVLNNVSNSNIYTYHIVEDKDGTCTLFSSYNYFQYDKNDLIGRSYQVMIWKTLEDIKQLNFGKHQSRPLSYISTRDEWVAKIKDMKFYTFKIS